MLLGACKHSLGTNTTFANSRRKALHKCSHFLFDPFFSFMQPFPAFIPDHSEDPTQDLHLLTFSLNFLPGTAPYCLASSSASSTLIQHLHLLPGLKDAERTHGISCPQGPPERKATTSATAVDKNRDSSWCGASETTKGTCISIVSS